jgi:hypothetical protein
VQAGAVPPPSRMRIIGLLVLWRGCMGGTCVTLPWGVHVGNITNQNHTTVTTVQTHRYEIIHISSSETVIAPWLFVGLSSSGEPHTK